MKPGMKIGEVALKTLVDTYTVTLQPDVKIISKSRSLNKSNHVLIQKHENVSLI